MHYISITYGKTLTFFGKTIDFFNFVCYNNPKYRLNKQFIFVFLILYVRLQFTYPHI